MFELERDPLFKLNDIHDLTKAEIRERTMAKFVSMAHYLQSESIPQFQQVRAGLPLRGDSVRLPRCASTASSAPFVT